MLLHACVTLGVYLLTHAVLGDIFDESVPLPYTTELLGEKPFVAFTSAMLFAIHPVSILLLISSVVVYVHQALSGFHTLL